MIEIKQSFETEIAAITPALDTGYEGVRYDPIVGRPYQELYLLPALNDNIYIDGEGFVSYGIFQITLRYPTGTNASKNILERIKLILDTFPSGSNLVKDGITTNIVNTPSVKNMGIVGDRLVYVVSINYQAFY